MKSVKETRHDPDKHQHYEEHRYLPFDELPETTKERVLERYGDWNVDHEWWDYVYDWFAETMKAEGVEVDTDKTWFRGFWSQGDGAAWSGYLEDGAKWTRENMDEEYHRVLTYMADNGYLEASTAADGNFSYYQSCSVDADNPHEEHCYYRREQTGPGLYDYRYAPVGKQAKAYEAVEEAVEAFEEAWEEYCRDKAEVLYRMLEQEYEHLTSYEMLADTFNANDALFDTETGELFYK